MKLIITNNSLHHFCGSETWTYAMAKELSKKYEVEVVTTFKGEISTKIEKFCRVYDSMRDGDFYINNHHFDIPPDKPVVFTSHGRWGVELFPDYPCYKVGVTEETAKGNQVIRNGVDLERFNGSRPNKLSTVLYLSNPAYARAKEIVKEACKGLNVITIENEVFEIEELIKKADLVITLGRGIIESLACRKNVISADWREGWMTGLNGGGMITRENFDFLKTHAFSGRNAPINFTVDRLREELRKFNPDDDLRDLIEKEFDIKKTSKQYLDIWTSIKKDT